jgi:hypothetical protein
MMVIPSYWSRENKVGWKKGDAIYDHPTPLNEEGTLNRLFESIKILSNKDVEIIIIAVPTSKDIDKKVEEKVSNLVSSVSLDFKVSIIGPTHIKKIKDYFIDIGKKEYSELIKIRGYSNIRNLCLFIPAIMDADVAILIDDDEIFEDSMFLSKALEFIKKPIKGNLNYGVAGYYLQPDGDFQIKKSFVPWMKYWNKIEKMNEAFNKIIGSKPRIKETPFVFGGNMIIPKELFTKILFDPFVPRGEDIDYLLNAKMFGFNFYLDNQLSIKHIPPLKSHPTWQRLREDIFRFIYERMKIQNQKPKPGMNMVYPEELDPYPGCFLKNDLEYKIKHSNKLLSNEYLAQGDHEASKEALKNIFLAESKAIPTFDPFEKYCDLQKIWEKLLTYLQYNSEKEKLRAIVNK